jgi:hypothetical protein
MKEVNFVNLVNFAAGTLCEGLRVTVSYYLLIEDIYRMSNLGGLRGSDDLTVSVLEEVHQVHQVHRNDHKLRVPSRANPTAAAMGERATGREHGDANTAEGRAKCPRDPNRTNVVLGSSFPRRRAGQIPSSLYVPIVEGSNRATLSEIRSTGG